jgi:hypothetical protein
MPLAKEIVQTYPGWVLETYQYNGQEILEFFVENSGDDAYSAEELRERFGDENAIRCVPVFQTEGFVDSNGRHYYMTRTLETDSETYLELYDDLDAAIDSSA